MGKVQGEEVGFDPVLKEQEEFGCAELGKSAFQDKHKGKRDASACVR